MRIPIFFCGICFFWLAPVFADSGSYHPRCDVPERFRRIEGVGAEAIADLTSALGKVNETLSATQPGESAFNRNFLYHASWVVSGSDRNGGTLRLKSHTSSLGGEGDTEEVLNVLRRIRKTGLAGLRDSGNSLVLNQKLLLLSLLAADSWRGEDRLLALQLSRLLGFDKVSMDSSGRMWFRDPIADRYYVQEESRIVALPDGLRAHSEIGGRALSAISTAQSQPNVLTWVGGSLKGSAEYDKTSSSVRLDVSDRASLYGFEVEKKLGSGKRKNFLYQSESQTSEGTALVEAFGANDYYDSRDSRDFLGFDESDDFAAALSKIVSDSGITGYAKYDGVTGKISLRSLGEDLGLYEFSGAIEFSPSGRPFSADARRVFRDDQVSHDRIGVVFSTQGSTQGSKPRAYIVNRSDIYLLDGLEDVSALGFRNALKAAFPTQTVGEFAVVLDLARLLNQEGGKAAELAALDDIPASTMAKAEWKKSFATLMEFGAEAFYRRGIAPEAAMRPVQTGATGASEEFAGLLRLSIRY